MSETSVQPRRLTPKGEATRQKIIEAAAGLIYEHGVAGTNNELVRAAAGISGSQLSHYFPDKESLVRAVIAWRADTMIGLQRDPPLGDLDSIAALRAWADSYTGLADVCSSGCSFGSLAAEVIKSNLDALDEVGAGFGWRDQFERGMTAIARDKRVRAPVVASQARKDRVRGGEGIVWPGCWHASSVACAGHMSSTRSVRGRAQQGRICPAGAGSSGSGV